MAGKVISYDGYTWCIAPIKDLSGLIPLLREWIDVIKDYCRANRCTDNPWWYNERANIRRLDPQEEIVCHVGTSAGNRPKPNQVIRLQFPQSQPPRRTESNDERTKSKADCNARSR